MVRTYSSADPVRSPHPATDPVAYNKLCQQTPNAPDCALPLYWPAPPQILKTTSGMHRFTWDMHYDPIPGVSTGRRGGGDESGAVPHRTYTGVMSPWVAPGTYTVRLTSNGQTTTQPITVKMDPRVKITPEVQRLFALTTQIQNAAMEARAKHTKPYDDMAAQLIGCVMPMQGSEMPPTATQLEACRKQMAAYAALKSTTPK